MAEDLNSVKYSEGNTSEGIVSTSHGAIGLDDPCKTLLTSDDEQTAYSGPLLSKDERKASDICTGELSSSELDKCNSGHAKRSVASGAFPVITDEKILDECPEDCVTKINGNSLRKASDWCFEQEISNVSIDDTQRILARRNQYKLKTMSSNLNQKILENGFCTRKQQTVKNLPSRIQRHKSQEAINSCNRKESLRAPTRELPERLQRSFSGSDIQTQIKKYKNPLTPKIVLGKNEDDILKDRLFTLSKGREPGRQTLRFLHDKVISCRLTDSSPKDFGNQERLLDGQLKSFKIEIENMKGGNVSSLCSEGHLETSILSNYNHVYYSPIFEFVEDTSGESPARKPLQPLSSNACHKESSDSEIRTGLLLQDSGIAELNSELEFHKSTLQMDNKPFKGTISNENLQQRNCSPKNVEGKRIKHLLHTAVKSNVLEKCLEGKETAVKDAGHIIWNRKNDNDTKSVFNDSVNYTVETTKKEARQLNSYIAKLIGLNENLFKLSQAKVEQVNNLAKILAELQLLLSERTQENAHLTNTLQVHKEEMATMEQKHLIHKQQYALTLLRLNSFQNEITKQKETMDNITDKMKTVAETKKFLQMGIEKLKRNLQDARYRELQLKANLVHSEYVNDILREKINIADNDIATVKAEMNSAMTQNDMLKQASELRDRDIQSIHTKKSCFLHQVHRLEKEVMGKEDEIEALKRSLPTEFWGRSDA